MSRTLADIRALLVSIADDLARIEGRDDRASELAPDEGPTLTLTQAAHAAGWSISTTRRHLLRRKETHPADPLGHQAGGLRLTRWSVPRDRWLRYLRDLPRDDRDGTDDTCTGAGGSA